MNRRNFIEKNVLALAGGSLVAAGGRADAADTVPIDQGKLQNTLSPGVQMQFMRPAQLEAAGRKFPVVYVPFGLIEWHGRQWTQLGYAVVQSGKWGKEGKKGSGRFAYIDTESAGGVMIELLWSHR